MRESDSARHDWHFYSHDNANKLTARHEGGI
jgi:hypothetical protein